jgi:hypothetical protein
MASPPPSDLLRRGLALEYTTLGWNVVGVAVLAWSAIKARSVALAGFGLDSLIEIGASVVVVWELTTVVLTTGHHAGHSMAGIIWTRSPRWPCSSWPGARHAPGPPWATSCSAPRAG